MTWQKLRSSDAHRKTLTANKRGNRRPAVEPRATRRPPTTHVGWLSEPSRTARRAILRDWTARRAILLDWSGRRAILRDSGQWLCLRPSTTTCQVGNNSVSGHARRCPRDAREPPRSRRTHDLPATRSKRRAKPSTCFSACNLDCPLAHSPRCKTRARWDEMHASRSAPPCLHNFGELSSRGP